MIDKSHRRLLALLAIMTLLGGCVLVKCSAIRLSSFSGDGRFPRSRAARLMEIRIARILSQLSQVEMTLPTLTKNLRFLAASVKANPPVS